MTVLNDILIPYLKEEFDLGYFHSMLVQTAFFGAYFLGSLIYFLASLNGKDPLNRLGYQRGIVVGLLISGLGCILFLPAEFLNSYGIFLLGLFTLGLGFTLLQIAANPYVTLVGSKEGASSRLNLAQGFNSLGTTLAPLVGGWVIFRLLKGDEAVGLPYLLIGSCLVLFALMFNFFRLPNYENPDFSSGESVWKIPKVRWGMIAIFCYVGAEVSIGSGIVNLLGLEEFGELSESESSKYLSLYWGGLMIGRFSGSAFLDSEKPFYQRIKNMFLWGIAAFSLVVLANFFGEGISYQEIGIFFAVMALSWLAFLLGKGLPEKSIALFSIIIVSLLLLTSLSIGKIALWAVLGIGLFNSIMWSNIFSISIEGLGDKVPQASSLLVMAILGGAVLPPLQGLMADILGLQLSYLLPIPCYVVLFLFGSRLTKVNKASFN